MYYQQGGQQDQIMQLIQMYAQMNQMDPQELMQQLQQMPPEEQQQAIQQMAQTVEQGGAGQQQPDMTQAAMRYGGYMTGMFAEGGEPNGGMALGQISAVADKMNKLRQFVSPEQNLDPWIASKLAVIDDSTASISDYMMYNPEAQGGGEEMEMYEQEEMMEQMANGGYTVTRSSDRKGKTHKVTGPDGTVKYFGDSNLGQHPKDPERKKAFYARHKTNLANNPFFRAFARKTWKEGGSTFSGNAFYQGGGEPQIEDYPDYGSYRADLYRFNAGQMGDQALPQSLMPEERMPEERKVEWHPEWKEQGIDPEADYAASLAASVANGAAPVSSSPAPVVNAQPAASTPARTIDYSGVSIVDLLKSAGKASDYNSRKELAAKLGIDNYYGSAKQNLDLIKKVTSNAAVLDDYQSAMPSRSGSTRRSSLNSNGTISTTTKNSNGTNTTELTLDAVADSMRKLEADDMRAGSLNGYFAQAKQAYLAANPGMTSADYDSMQMNRPGQTYLSPSNKSFFETSSGEYDDSYMLNKIANDPHSPGNVRKQKQKDFAMNMGTALLAALIPSIGFTRYLPMLRGLPAASKLVKALPQGAKALPKPVPTNWVTNSGKAFEMGGGYAPAMRKKANFAMGGPAEGEVINVSPEELEMLRQQGYQFEIM